MLTISISRTCLLCLCDIKAHMTSIYIWMIWFFSIYFSISSDFVFTFQQGRNEGNNPGEKPTQDHPCSEVKADHIRNPQNEDQPVRKGKDGQDGPPCFFLPVRTKKGGGITDTEGATGEVSAVVLFFFESMTFYQGEFYATKIRVCFFLEGCLVESWIQKAGDWMWNGKIHSKMGCKHTRKRLVRDNAPIFLV